MLCTGEKGVSKLSGKPLHFKGSKIHKVYRDYILQGGDFTRGDGRGGESIYQGGTLPDEDLKTAHKWGPGTLAMANVRGESDSSNSQFFITLSNEPLNHLQGNYVAFGRVKSGSELLHMLSSLGGDSDSDGKPKAEILISNCGMLDRSVPQAAALAASQGLASFLQFKLNQIDKKENSHGHIEDNAKTITRATSIAE